MEPEKKTEKISRADMPTTVRRFMPAEMEMRAAKEGDDKKGMLHGYAAKFNKRGLLYKWSDEEWWEVIEPGFFDGVLENDVRCLKNHDSNLVLGRSEAGTLKLATDDTGLLFDAMLDENITYANDTILSVLRRDISQCSFSFTIKKQMWEEKEIDGKIIVTRHLQECKQLYDVGPVTFPFYEDTDVSYDQKAIRAESPDDYRADLERWRSSRKKEQTQKINPNHLQRQRRMRILELEQ